MELRQSDCIVVHDEGVEGQWPGRPYRYMRLSRRRGATDVLRMFAEVPRSGRARRGLNVIFVCHGLFEDPDVEGTGGFGLNLGGCRVDGTALHRFAPWSGLFDRIVLFACGAANTADGHLPSDGIRGRGEQFCRYLALYTNTEVYASRHFQVYERKRTLSDLFSGRPGVINFGRWEGSLVRFDPRGIPSSYPDISVAR